MEFTKENLELEIASLKELRGKLNVTLDTIREIRREFEESLDYLKEKLVENRTQVNAKELLIRKIALGIFTDDPLHNKTVHPKIKERDVTIFHYEKGKAEEWCREHGGLFLVLDTTAFERYLNTINTHSHVPDFVIARKEPQITIAKEL